MAYDPSSSETVPGEFDATRLRQRFQFSLRSLFVLTLLAAIASAVSAYYVRKQSAIDKAWKRMALVKSIADKILRDEETRLKKQGPDILESMDSSTGLNEGYERTEFLKDWGNRTLNRPDATGGGPISLVALHIKAILLEPVELDDLGGNETAAVIDKIAAELEKAGISVRRAHKPPSKNQ